MAKNTEQLKEELAGKAEVAKTTGKLTKSMDIADMIKVMEPQIKRALPEVITVERFTRMALSALNTTPKLRECTQMSLLAALMNAAQLGLEPNTPFVWFLINKEKERYIMKKILLMIIGSCLVLNIVACGNISEDGSSKNSTVNSVVENVLSNVANAEFEIYDGTQFCEGVAFVDIHDQDGEVVVVGINKSGEILFELEDCYMGA